MADLNTKTPDTQYSERDPNPPAASASEQSQSPQKPADTAPAHSSVELNNSLPKLGLKMFGSTLYATGFCIIVLVFMSFLINEGAWGAVLYQLTDFVLYTPIIYMAAWRCGSREQNYVHFGHMKEDLWRGTKIGLIAIAPYSICFVLMLLSKAGILPNLLWIIRIVYAPFVVLFNLLVPNVTAAGTGVSIDEISYLGIFLASLLQLYVPLVTGIAYRLGYKGISLYQKLIYQNKKPSDQKKA